MKKRDFEKLNKNDKCVAVSTLICSVVFSVLITLVVLTLVFTFILQSKQAEFYSFRIVKNIFEKYAYESVDEDYMTQEALRAYVKASGDRYAEYYNAEEYAALKDSNGGRYVGIGITVAADLDNEIPYGDGVVSALRIEKIKSDSPVAETDISEGDFLYSFFDGEVELTFFDVDRVEFVSHIRGVEGTEVKFSVLKNENGVFEKKIYTLVRRGISIESASCSLSEINSEVGVVRINEFNSITPQQLRMCLNALNEQGIEDIVIDLRNNPGGNIVSVASCASFFLNEGDLVVTTETRDGKKDYYYANVRTGQPAGCNVDKEDIGKFGYMNIAVLVNENTASGAELLCAVLRDYNMCIVVGKTTFGKGCAQDVLSLESLGVDGGMKLTSKLYFPPSGEGYDGIGITPDFEAEYDFSESVAINELLK